MNRFALRVGAQREEPLSRWLWMVKWLLLIPHYLVLIGLWVAFVVLTLVAYLAVLFTGRYPPPIFAFNLGVLRWSWRVNYYGYWALGTDRYPPFTLADVPDYPARLTIDEPGQPPRWLPLVAWLFAIPHLLLLGSLTGATWQWRDDDSSAPTLGVLGLALLIAGISLLFTGRYPRGLYDLLLGVARWNLRVVAYLALLTPRYPPFRLDQGDHEPDPDPAGPAGSMLTVEAPTAVAAAHATPPAGRSAAGPSAALVVGVLLAFAAGGIGTGGGALLALAAARDATGYATSPTLRVASPTAAVTAEHIEIQAGDLWSRNLADLGGVRITATGAAGTTLFVGVAPQAAVDSWLAGTAHDQFTGVSSGNARYQRADGATRSAAAPAEQAFWLATAAGAGPVTLNWQAGNGDFAVVLANADGSPGVTGTVQAATQVPDVRPLGVGLLTTGIILLMLALGLIVLGGIGLGRRHMETTPAPGPSMTSAREVTSLDPRR